MGGAGGAAVGAPGALVVVAQPATTTPTQALAHAASTRIARRDDGVARVRDGMRFDSVAPISK